MSGNTIKCKRTGEGLGFQIDGGWCVCRDLSKCGYLAEMEIVRTIAGGGKVIEGDKVKDA